MPRFQFSLRTLLIIVTLLAIPCGWLGWQSKLVRERKEVLEWLDPQHVSPTLVEPDKYGIYGFTNWTVKIQDDRLVWYRKLLGDHFVSEVHYRVPLGLSRIHYRVSLDAITEAFPEASVSSDNDEP